MSKVSTVIEFVRKNWVRSANPDAIFAIHDFTMRRVGVAQGLPALAAFEGAHLGPLPFSSMSWLSTASTGIEFVGKNWVRSAKMGHS